MMMLMMIDDVFFVVACCDLFFMCGMGRSIKIRHLKFQSYARHPRLKFENKETKIN